MPGAFAFISVSQHHIKVSNDGKAIKIKLGGKQYAFKPDFPGTKDKKKKKIGEVYDLDSYLRARKHGGNLILKGYLRLDVKTGKIGFEEI